MAVRIDGKAVARKVREEVAQKALRFREKFGRAPGLHVVLVGDDAASAVYVRNKETAAHEANIAGQVHRLPAATSEADVLALVRELNARDDVDGILVQFPVPSHISQARIVETIDRRKDVDGLHAENAGLLWSGTPALAPCTPSGCIRLLDETGVDLRGKNAVVVGRSNLVGKPIAALLLARDCTVTMAHSRTVDLASVCRQADILVAAVGRARLIQGDWVKPGAIVLDVGMNRLDDGKLVGDVDYDAAEKVAGFITPVPGGVGPMTIAHLLENTLQAGLWRLGATL